MKILGIETSCDETAAAVVEDGARILSNAVVSQIDIFAEYGGVIPEVAARSHFEVILPVIDKALSDASCSWNDIDAIAVTYAPGLLGSLLIGTLTARTLAILHDKPLYAVHHLKSHVYANWLKQDTEMGAANHPSFPLLSLVVSGGHTQILYMPGHNQFEIIGTTKDDAVGECFDKVAKILGLPYPGGPSIAKAELEKAQKKSEEVQEYIKLSREIVHHEKYLSEIRGDDEDLIEAKKRLQRAKAELKKHVDSVNRLKSQIGHYENALKKAQKPAKKKSELWYLQE